MMYESENDINYWASFVDIFLSLFFIFLVLFYIFFFTIKQFEDEELKEFNDISYLLENIPNIEYVKMENKIIINESILFSISKSELNDEGIAFAVKFSKALNDFLINNDRYKKYCIIVEGHTDRSGDEFGYDNYKLGLNRARSFVKQIKLNLDDQLKKNVDIVQASYGSEKPKKDSNKDSESYYSQNDRRIEVRIIPKLPKVIENIFSNN